MTCGAHLHALGASVAILVGCGSSKEAQSRDQVQATTTPNASADPWAVPSDDPNETLPAARAKFRTKLIDSEQENVAPESPPKSFRLVHYDAPPGKLAAYLTPDPKDGAKHPAIVWITGGDCNSIGPVWMPADPENDQTAAQYPAAGIVTMYPSLRGGNNNPGRKEGFYGEVDDVLAAADFLAKQSYVDPAHIYLGGHSTGGTLVLLVAAAAPKDKFRAVFAFGPTDDVAGYGDPNPFCPFDMSNRRELELRSPLRWINTVSTPTFVFEGTAPERANLDALLTIKARSMNPLVKFFPMKGRNHFDILAPANKFLASQIIGPWASGPLELSEEAVVRAVAKQY